MRKGVSYLERWSPLPSGLSGNWYIGPRRFIYAFTGRTGEGKTSVCLRLAAHVAQGTPLGDAAVTQGRVLYLAGENPDDIRMRWILLLEQMWLDENEVAVDFVDGRFKITEIPQHILAAAAKRGSIS